MAKRKNPETVGTSHFSSRMAANRYYKDYGYDAADVARKIKDGEIHIGRPKVGPGEKVVYLDGGLRYGIQKQNPSPAAADIGSKAVLCRVKRIGNKLHITKVGR